MGVADLGGRLFSYQIKYHQRDGITNPDPAQFSGKNVTPRYNGSIAEVDWRAVETAGVNPPLAPKRYGYAYDPLNRLTAGYYQNPDNPYSKENTESVSYDLNGNITGLYRTSVMEYGSNTATVIDNLNYTYTGNQATSINDASQNFAGYEGGGNTITYDANGNMLSMPDKGISAIKYNYLNLPVYLNVNKFGNEDVTINTKYSADGTRLRKENTTVSTGFKGSTTIVKSTDYLDGFQYFSSRNITLPDGGFELMSDRAMQPQTFSVAERKAPMPSKTADLQFFPTAEGFYDYQKDQYIYQHRDHLGNVRVSYGRNSSGVLEILDNNDYYPFGLNHLKSGTAFFGQGSYKSYKYNGKELQETGMYSYGWREYMPDIGRWNGIDQLAEKYLSTGTYTYVANNPVSNADVDGRWFNDDGSIDVSGTANGFVRTRSYTQSYLGQYPGQGGGGGNYTPFGQTQAYSDLMDALKAGGTGELTNIGGILRWWTDLGQEDNGLIGSFNMLKLNPSGLSDNWYETGGRGNWFFGTGSVLSGFAGAVQSQHMYSQGIRRGLTGNYQLTGRNLSQFGSMRMNEATIPISKIGRAAKFAGHASFYLGVAFDTMGVINGNVSVGKAILNTGFGIAGNWGGPIGASVSTVYFGVDNFYPGAWPGLFDDGNTFQRNLDNGFNQAGPYRINVFGAHEPK